MYFKLLYLCPSLTQLVNSTIAEAGVASLRFLGTFGKAEADAGRGF